MSSIEVNPNTESNVAQVLARGGVIAYPTEAVWGLGCDMDNEQAVKKILSLKQRPIEKGLICIAANAEQIICRLPHLTEQQRARIRDDSLQVLEDGRAVTWLVKHVNCFPKWITGEHETVAVRICRHPVAAALCEAHADMLVSTSANPAGLVEARNEREARAYFADRIDAYIAGEVDLDAAPSAIIDMTTGERYR